MGDLTLTYMAMFGIALLAIMALVSNSGADSINAIEDQIFLMNCPDPIYNGVATLNTIEGFTINYTVTYSSSTTSFNGTFFECSIDSITGAFTANTVIKPYDATLFNFIPIGWLGFIGDWISNGLLHVQTFLTLVAFVLTPANFSVLGYTLDDLSGLAVALIVAVYATAYAFLGAWVYKTVSPFAGSG